MRNIVLQAGDYVFQVGVCGCGGAQFPVFIGAGVDGVFQGGIRISQIAFYFCTMGCNLLQFGVFATQLVKFSQQIDAFLLSMICVLTFTMQSALQFICLLYTSPSPRDS